VIKYSKKNKKMLDKIINLINGNQLLAIAIYCTNDRLADLMPNLNVAMAKYNIDTKIRKAQFLAQVCHESDGLNTCCEYADGSDYEGDIELGNVQDGDGVRFKGRGLIQITGRSNYLECGKALGIDLIASPERLQDLDLACLSAGWYWDSRSLNKLADDPNFSPEDNCTRITKIVNGGYNGLDERLGYLDRALKAL